MRKIRWQLAFASALLFSLAIQAVAERIPRRPVPPIVRDGIQYAAKAELNGKAQYVVASDASTGRELWRVQVFYNRIKFWINEESQIMYITDLKLDGNSIQVRDEKARCYSFDITKKDVFHMNCGNVFGQ